jgi:1-aminocyclopropane-1-carboxylate deaminase/D-cysteine desulfhydrase-like pyridoxal-dependent ACC family enzyme
MPPPDLDIQISGAWHQIYRQHVLFVHTGGSPALYAYEKVILEGIQ